MWLRRGIIASLVVAIVIPLAFTAIVFPLTVDVPQYDEWSRIPLLEAYYEHRPVLPLILQPYNGHIIAVPRAILLVTAVATHWNLRAEILLCYLVAFTTCAVLVLMLRDSGRHTLLLAAPVTMMVFSFMNFAVFLNAFPLCEHLCLLGLVATIFALTRPAISGRHVAAAMFAAAIATFSWGGGIVVWPIGAVALLARCRWVSVTTWCAPAIAA
ncbi:MAG TPA: hypothetical protein VN181_07990, partial [Thermoanaerobaculia bacterium]|nr:hypothetical protein [Thermoanaerobaculia bacterium]